MERLSGDQNKMAATPSVPGSACASSVSSDRTHIWFMPALAAKASFRPSGDIDGGALGPKVAFSGGRTWKRTSSGAGGVRHGAHTKTAAAMATAAAAQPAH